ncbi:hypothetical protein JCM9803A_39850 [Rhodococcus erythropolis]
MAVSQRTESANRLVYVDESGVEHEILLALLGGQTVWDGRISQSVPASTGSMSLAGFDAAVSSGSTVTATDVGYATLAGLAAETSAGSSVAAAPAELETAGLEAEISVGSTLEATAATLSGTGLDAEVTVSIGPVFDPGHLSIEAMPAEVVVSADIDASPAALTLAGLPADVLGGTTVQAATGAATIAGLPAEVSSGSTVTATDVGYATLTGLSAGTSAGSTVGAASTPELTATGLVADAVAVHFSPSGMTKNGNWVPTANGAWIVVPAWTADSGSTVSGNGVQARGAKANAVISGQLSIAAAGGAYQVSVRLKVDGVVVKTITDYPLAGYTTTNVPIASDPMAVTAGQVATIECWFVNYANSFTIQSGASTYVRIT